MIENANVQLIEIRTQSNERCVFFFNDTATTEIYTLPLHDALPILRLYWDQAVYKKPEYPKPFPWHQDNGYTYIEPQAYLTCWVALNDATLDNGCPWVIPGGHLRGTLAHRASKLGFVCREDDG